MTTTPTRGRLSASTSTASTPAGTVVWSPSTSQLYEDAVRRGQAASPRVARLQSIRARSPAARPRTSSSSGSPESEERIWWGEDQPPLAGRPLRRPARKGRRAPHAQDPLYVVDAFAGADPAHRIARARDHRAARTTRCSRRPCSSSPTSRSSPPSCRRRSCSMPPASRPCPTRTAPWTGTFVVLHPTRTEVLVGGTFYGGEIKKSIFTVMNDRLPLEGVLPMHCSANVGADGRVAVFFGLSGTGKTTSPPIRPLSDR